MGMDESVWGAPALMSAWKAHKATQALEKYWDRTVPEGTSFEQSEAVGMVIVTLECYEMTLRKIAERGGADAPTAKEALAFKPPVWREIPEVK
jgi:hypothetical protein